MVYCQGYVINDALENSEICQHAGEPTEEFIQKLALYEILKYALTSAMTSSSLSYSSVGFSLYKSDAERPWYPKRARLARTSFWFCSCFARLADVRVDAARGPRRVRPDIPLSER